MDLNCLKDNGNLSFDSKTNADTFMKFYYNLASDLVKKLPSASKKIGINIVKKTVRNSTNSCLSY